MTKVKDHRPPLLLPQAVHSFPQPEPGSRQSIRETDVARTTWKAICRGHFPSPGPTLGCDRTSVNSVSHRGAVDVRVYGLLTSSNSGWASSSRNRVGSTGRYVEDSLRLWVSSPSSCGLRQRRRVVVGDAQGAEYIRFRPTAAPPTPTAVYSFDCLGAP